MTIPSSTRTAGPFNGNGVTTVFPFTFKVFAASDLRIVKTDTGGIESDLTIGANPTVSLNANQDVNPGGSVTYTTLATGEKLTIVGNTSDTQPLDLFNGGGFFPQAIENALDRCMMVIQQFKSRLSRAITFPVSDSSSLDKELPTANLRANKALVFGPDGSVGLSASDYEDQAADAAASAAAAAASAAAAAATLDDFDDKYLGMKPTPPATDNDGDPLEIGALYFDTTDNEMKVWESPGVWMPIGRAGSVTVIALNGDGVTVLFPLGVDPITENNTEVHVDGVYQTKDTYSLVGNSVLFSEAPATGTDNIEVLVVKNLPLGASDAANASFIQAGAGAVERDVQTELRETLKATQFDGVVDGAPDSTTGLQNAINSSVGRTLVIPKGTFTASQLSFPHSMRVVGEPGAVLRQKSGTNNFFLQPTADGINVAFAGVTLDQNNAGQTTGSGKFLFNSVRTGAVAPLVLEFDNVTFKDFCEGAVRVVGDRTSGTREVLKLRDCKFRGGTESESAVYDTFTVFAADAAEVVVDGCDFDHGLTLTKQGIPAISVGGVITPSPAYTEVTIRNNRFRNYGRFTVGSGIGVIDCYAWAENIDISGNKFVGSYVVPIRAKTNSRNMVVQGNIMSAFNNPGTASLNGGISIVAATLAPTLGRYIIASNIIDSPLYRGIEISDGGGTSPESLVIADNIVRGTGDVGILLLGCKNFAITGNNIANASQQAVTFSTCQGTGRIDGNVIDTTAQTGIQAIGSQLALDLQVHGNFVANPTICGVTVENVRTLSLQDNIVKDVILSGSQRGYRVGGSTGTAVGQVKNNLALGSFATAPYSVITAGFTSAVYEYGNSWNFQETYAPAAPTTGTWARGDKVWHSSPAAGGNIGWVCTTAGTPGTWKTFGAIQA